MRPKAKRFRELTVVRITSTVEERYIGFDTVVAKPSQKRIEDPGATTDFDHIVEEHSVFVYNVAFRMMGNPQDAEDVAQEAFISAYRAFGRFRGDSKVTTWLYRITVNAALMRLRKERKARELTRTGLEDVVIPDWSDAPYRAATDSELGERLREGIGMLPDDMKAAVVLRDMEELSNAEAADVIGISVPALKSRLHRGRVLLRKHLEEYLKTK